VRERVCKNCGGKKYRVVGQNMLKCEFCGTLYVDEQASKEEEVLIVGAYQKLRDFKFAEAVSEFDKIITLFPMSYEAYFGRALAKNKIILYNNRRNVAKKPRMCGDEISAISNDEDYKKAIELAPQEVVKDFSEKARRIDKIAKGYELLSEKAYDLVMVAVDPDKPQESDLFLNAVEMFKNDGREVYTFQLTEQKEKEEETFRALKTANAMVFFANKEKGISSWEVKHVYDRYLNKIFLKQKAKGSLVIAKDKEIQTLPNEFKVCKNIVQIGTESFLQDLKLLVDSEIKNTIAVKTKIETVKLENKKPQKKEYVDVETVKPSDLGNYHVDNIELSDVNRIKWIFLAMKNGDFSTARDLLNKELEKDPYNAELYLADLMETKKIKTQEDFFSNISNFADKERVDKILTYATKTFAEYFVDNWERLIVSIGSEEYYNAFIIYLAKFNTPYREEFIRNAENVAVDTLNAELIEKVLKCFNRNDVDRFVNFYFLLAQKSDNNEYYQKILDIDQGHEQSNLAILMQHFKTAEDKLNYRNREEVESVLRYLSESSRAQFVTAVVNMIVPLAFYDIDKVQAQIDFYLSYVVNNEKLVALLKDVAGDLQQLGFFKLAERYISIAISKNPKDAELYWMLIKIKAHCKNDQELISSNIKVAQFPEWETLLALADEKSSEHYAEIVSKSNLYQGERTSYGEDKPDRVMVVEKLKAFLIRNEKILLEISKQEGGAVDRSVEYYKLQLKPFENYINQFKKADSLEEFESVLNKMNTRLSSLNLTLDQSVNVIHLLEREDGLKSIYKDPVKMVKTAQKKEKTFKRTEFLKKFSFIFIELIPLLFTTMLLTMLLVDAKEVYLYFSQDFLVISVLFSLAIALLNFVLYKRSRNPGWALKLSKIALIVLGIADFALMLTGFYIIPSTIEINSAKEMKILLNNANTCNYQLTQDLDMSDIEWKGVNFTGNFEGNGFTISNLKFAKEDNVGLFKTNDGLIENLNIVLAEHSYENVGYFAPLAMVNTGEIKNCTVVGKVSITSNFDSIISGMVGRMSGGELESCQSNIKFTLAVEAEKVFVGGLVGDVVKGKKELFINKNHSTIQASIQSKNTARLYVGGLVGNAEHIAEKQQKVEKNVAVAHISLSGTTENLACGGLFGRGLISGKNNYAQGEINVESLTGSGYVGGLYGKYQNSNLKEEILHSYANVDILNNSFKKGQLIGGLGGKVRQCFAVGDYHSNITSTPYLHDLASISESLILADRFYDPSLNFDGTIWLLTDIDYPRLK